MTEATTRRTRRYDPGRRARIAVAALQVVTRDGVEGLTHRAVAAQADVPVGSTTYHFADKDALLLAAIELAEERSANTLEQTFVDCRPEDDLAGAIAEFLQILTGRDREKFLLDYEIFLAARRRPALQPTAAAWIEECYTLIACYTDEQAARIVTDLIEGLLAQAVVFGRELTADRTRPTFVRVLQS
ncbi:TetR/AcrR family transcriptional regulator [Rhodococcus sp. NPDC057529]|uniref:TetR/AcrR family transcriptional regulator n=1 Tax=Rhodococcus sp. NPDC057529 TaxID=3346158 RepID=UPI0036712F0F